MIGMCKLSLATTALCFIVTFATSELHSRERRSGISDQRLAEIETLLHLAKQGNRGYGIAYGVIDPNRIGKRKRSFDAIGQDEDNSLQSSMELPFGHLGEERPKQLFTSRNPGRFPFRTSDKVLRFALPELLEDADTQRGRDK